jgi:hypothetical protein
LIEAANKYGLTNLKLKAEAGFVSSTYINFDNLMELLHFANSKNCYLLQEAVMDFIVKNKVEILEKKRFLLSKMRLLPATMRNNDSIRSIA